jgi:hypothetical protein
MRDNFQEWLPPTAHADFPRYVQLAHSSLGYPHDVLPGFTSLKLALWINSKFTKDPAVP